MISHYNSFLNEINQVFKQSFQISHTHNIKCPQQYNFNWPGVMLAEDTEPFQDPMIQLFIVS